ncbi:MAG: hypothetical protein R6T93_07030 [Trueperaceae bacterium]
MAVVVVVAAVVIAVVRMLVGRMLVVRVLVMRMLVVRMLVMRMLVMRMLVVRMLVVRMLVVRVVVVRVVVVFIGITGREHPADGLAGRADGTLRQGRARAVQQQEQEDDRRTQDVGHADSSAASGPRARGLAIAQARGRAGPRRVVDGAPASGHGASSG